MGCRALLRLRLRQGPFPSLSWSLVTLLPLASWRAWRGPVETLLDQHSSTPKSWPSGWVIREIIPNITDVAVLLNPDNPISGPSLQAIATAAGPLKARLFPVEVRRPNDFETAFAAITK